MNFVIKRHSNHYYCNCRQIINGIYFIQIGSIIICGLLGQWRVYYTHTTTQLYYFPHTYIYIYIYGTRIRSCVIQKLFIKAFWRGKVSKNILAIRSEKDCQPNDYMKIAQFDASGRIFSKQSYCFCLIEYFPAFWQTENWL